MAHTLAIAKATLAAGLLQQDPKSVSREEINAFHKYLEAALVRCSPENIQVWKLPSYASLPALNMNRDRGAKLGYYNTPYNHRQK